MSLAPFAQVLPEVARTETRVCDVPSPDLGVPAGSYFLREFYCIDPDCDCRRVLVQFIPKGGPLEPVATLNFGWEKAMY